MVLRKFYEKQAKKMSRDELEKVYLLALRKIDSYRLSIEVLTQELNRIRTLSLERKKFWEKVIKKALKAKKTKKKK